MSSIAKQTHQSKGLPRKQSVKFKNRVMNREALHINNYTAEEIQATWYSCDEILGFKKSCIQTALLLVQQKLSGRNIIENSSFCSRGVESMLNKRVIRQRRVDAWSAILGEQQHHIDEEDHEARIIANHCSEITVIARKEARSRGVYDEKQVQQDRDLESTKRFRRLISSRRETLTKARKEASHNISLEGGLQRFPHRREEDPEAVRPSAVVVVVAA
jgi:hypothetical protein